MSTSAIAPIVGVSVGQVHADKVFSSEQVDVTPDLPLRSDDWTVPGLNPIAGEVSEAGASC